jgi:hypothetical protein
MLRVDAEGREWTSGGECVTVLLNVGRVDRRGFGVVGFLNIFIDLF